MKFSTLIGKKVISLYDRCIAGVTIGATFKDNLRKISHLVIEDNLEDGLFDELYVDVKNLFSYSGDALVIKNNYALKSLGEASTLSPIGLEVYSIKGASLGKIVDLELDDKFVVQKYITQTNQIDSSSVAGINSGIMLVQESDEQNKKVDITKFKHKTKTIKAQTQNQVKAVILPVYREEDIKQNEQAQGGIEVKTISNAISGGILVGRIATQNITAQNGEIVCRAGCKITDEVINRANAYSKLRELAFYAK